jgi:hypothetical protein
VSGEVKRREIGSIGTPPATPDAGRAGDANARQTASEVNSGAGNERPEQVGQAGVTADGQPVCLDPIAPTVIAPKAAAVPLAPTAWDDISDGQHTVTPDGRVWHRRTGLWHADPWWQGVTVDEITDVCSRPDEYAYDLGWPRAVVEDVHGPMTPVQLPHSGRRPMTTDRPCPECGTPAEELCVHMERLLAALRREAAEADNAGEGEFLDPAGRLPGHPEYCAEGCIHLPASPTTPDAGREAIGRCGDEWPTNGENYGLPFEWCALPAGHAGWHRSDRGTEWLRRAMTIPDAGRAGDTLREAMVELLWGSSVRLIDETHDMVDALLALPEMQELRTLADFGRQVRAMHADATPDRPARRDNITALLARFAETHPEVQALLAAEKERDELRATVERVEALVEPGDPDIRMHAYYYGFERTGVGVVDAILSAVAQAGKSYHSTESWADEDEWTSPSHEQRIQDAANDAADRIRCALGGSS